MRREKKKKRIRKLTEAKGEHWRNESSGGALDSRRKGYQCGRLQCSLPPSPPLSLSPPRHDKNRRQVKRRDGSARLLRRSALKVPFAYRAKTRREEKKMRMRFARRRLGREKAMVIEEAGGERGGRKGRATAKRSKSREGKFRYCLRQPRGTQRLKRR